LKYLCLNQVKDIIFRNIMKSKYNFDIDFLSSLNLSCKKYTLDFIINRIIYYNNNNNNNIILKNILSKSKKNNKLNMYILKKIVKSFIISDFYKKPPNYLDFGNKINYIII